MSGELVPVRHQVPAAKSTKSALGRHQDGSSAIQPAKKPITELAQPTLALSRITPYRTMELHDGAVLREFWKIGCEPTRSMRSTLNDPKVARQCAFITVDRTGKSFKIGFYPNGEAGQVVENLPISQLPQAVDDLVAAGFHGTRRAAPTETLAICV